MKNLTVNKSNWSGEEITVNINEDNTFTLYDYMFALKARQVDGDTVYELTSPDWSYAVVTGYKFEGEKNCCMQASGCEREAEDPFEAAIQVLCNII